MKTFRLFTGCAAVFVLFLVFSLPCRGNEISKSYWFITEDDGTAELSTYAPFGAHITFKDAHGNTVGELNLAAGVLTVSLLSDLGYPQGELFCLHIESDRYISCWLQQYFNKTRHQMVYPAQYNTYVYPSTAGEGVSTNDYFWIFSETTQQINFFDNDLDPLFSQTVLAGEIVTVSVSEDLGILEIPYVVSIAGSQHFVVVFHDAPNFAGTIQTIDR